MNFEVKKDKEDKKYIWLKDIKLEQGLETAYDMENKKVLILDPSNKNLENKPYTKTVDLEHEGKELKLGIVQTIPIEGVMAIAELAKVIRNL